MTDAAIIAGSLVDVRNVGSAKSVKLTVHVPEEYARKVIDAFGWPTGAAPVSVAVARLDERKVVSAERQTRTTDTPPRLDSNASAGADKPKKSPAQIAGYLCTLPLFQAFLRERYEPQWLECTADTYSDDKTAAAVVREICKVNSRADLTDKNTEWNALQLAFRLWENHPELEDA